jgi:hypothetical protein
VTGIGSERQLPGRPTTGARPDIALGDETALDELAHTPDDDRPAKARPVDELRAGSRSAEPDLVEDENEGVERFIRERPGATGSERWVIGHGAIIRRATGSYRHFCT